MKREIVQHVNPILVIRPIETTHIVTRRRAPSTRRRPKRRLEGLVGDNGTPEGRWKGGKSGGFGRVGTAKCGWVDGYQGVIYTVPLMIFHGVLVSMH